MTLQALMAVTFCLLLVGWTLSRRRPLILALLFSMGIVWLGQQGELNYLGVSMPSEQSYQGPMLTLGSAALLNLMLASMRVTAAGKVSGGRSWMDRRLTAYVVAAAGTALLLFRFARFGVPVLNASRFSVAAAISPLESILTAVCLVVSTAMLGALPSRLPFFARLVIGVQFVLVAFNASRLLLVAMIAALIAGRMAVGAWRLGVRSLIGISLAVAAMAMVVLPAIYTTRAGDDAGASELAERAQRQSGTAAPVVRVLGSGTYISARNGSAVATRLLETSEAPPEGFVLRAVAHVASIVPLAPDVQDPERFLTTDVYDLDEDEIGSVALPVPTAFQLDFGLWGSAALGLLYILGYDLSRTRGPVTAAWWAFGVALSAYGMYLLSVQFLGILAGFVVVRAGARSQTSVGPPTSVAPPT